MEAYFPLMLHELGYRRWACCNPYETQAKACSVLICASTITRWGERCRYTHWHLKLSPRNDTPVLRTFHWSEQVTWPQQTSESDEREDANIYIHICICICITKSRKKDRGTPPLLRNPTTTLGNISGETWVKKQLLKNGRNMYWRRGSDELKHREEKFVTEILIWGLFLMSTFTLFLWKYQDLLI